MELDHVFIFTEAPQQVATSFRQFGLTEGTPNVHPGQGTSCRRYFFGNAYLELVWVSNEEQIINPVISKTKLWERSQYQLTNYCPFGLCFRNPNLLSNSPTLLFEDGWKYQPPYLPEGVYVNVASNTDFRAEPMLFEMPFFGIAPKDYPPEKRQPLNHEMGLQEITKVILTLPVTMESLSPALQKVLSNSIVTLSQGKDYSVELEFDHGKRGEKQPFKQLIPLTFRW